MMWYLFMNCIILLYTLNNVYVTYNIKHKGNASCAIALMSCLRNIKSDQGLCMYSRDDEKEQEGPKCPNHIL